jgi:hypothetical protein
MGKKAKLGTGVWFAALKNKLSHRPGVSNPAALAASIGTSPGLFFSNRTLFMAQKIWQ